MIVSASDDCLAGLECPQSRGFGPPRAGFNAPRAGWGAAGCEGRGGGREREGGGASRGAAASRCRRCRFQQLHRIPPLCLDLL